jgi:hypothetical protein
LTLDQITKAHRKCALLVAAHGDEFLPAFLRMEAALDQAKQGESAIERARRIAAEAA